VECGFGSATWQTSSLAGTLIINRETQWDHLREMQADRLR